MLEVGDYMYGTIVFCTFLFVVYEYCGKFTGVWKNRKVIVASAVMYVDG